MPRRLRIPAAVAAMIVALSGGTALANGTSPDRVQTSMTFRSGPSNSFGLAGATRFDGYYDKSTKRVYFLGTRQADDSTSGEVWYYDTAKKKYVDTGTAMQTPISNYGIAGLTDQTGLGLYIFGGRDASGAEVTDVQAYYPGSNTAVKLGSKDAWPGTTPSGCVSLPAMGVAVVAGKAIVMGGIAFSSAGCADENSAQTWVFDPTQAAGKKWSQGPDLTLARGYITPAVLGGKVYAIGGDTNDAGVLTAQPIVESWKPFAGSWSDAAVADLTEPCDESQAFAFTNGQLANTITLAGCGQWPNDLPDVLQYDASGDSWSTVGSLLESRRNQAGAATVGAFKRHQLFIVGGYGSDGATVLETSEIGTITKGKYIPQVPRATVGSATRASAA
jgi:N-acetylneuraminic acid mutarotase